MASDISTRAAARVFGNDGIQDEEHLADHLDEVVMPEIRGAGARGTCIGIYKFAVANDFPASWVQKQIEKQLSADDLQEAGIESLTSMHPRRMMHQLADMAHKDSQGRRADFD